MSERLHMSSRRPVIGVTTDLAEDRYRVGRAYAAMLANAGATPVLLTAERSSLSAYLDLCDGFVLSGGDDPIMEAWDIPTHPKATRVDPQRQAFELALLAALDREPDRPVLGICLGMQYMALHAGGRLEQHLPDALPTADLHWGRREHQIDGSLGRGVVHSHHRQAVTDPGPLRVIARSEDGIIEAIDDPGRRHYVGVQWHPERTGTDHFGADLFNRLVEAAASLHQPA